MTPTRFPADGRRPGARNPLAGLLALALAAALPACGGGPRSERAPARAAAGPKPDVVFITVDTLRADRLGVYGYARAATPAWDAVAARGVRFERAYATFPKTNPSLCSMMTGRYPSAHGVRRNGARLPEPELTLAEILQAAGWRTAAFVGNHVVNSRHGLAQGFERYDEELPDRIPTRDAHERTATSMVDAVLRWLPSRPEGPLFLWIHFIDPHGPYTPPGFTAAPRPAGQPPGATLPVSDGDAGSGAIPAYQALPGVFEVDEYLARYDAEIAHMDAELGRLLEGLASAGIGEGDWTILSADHGESLGDHDLWFQHGSSLYEPQIRIPLVVAGPGLSPAVEPEPVSGVDIMPTLLEELGVPQPRGLQGMSLSPWLHGQRAAAAGSAAPTGRILFAELGEAWSGISGNEKVIWREGAPVLDLHDLASDPGETVDLARERPEAGRRIREAIERFAAANSRDVEPSTDEQTRKILKSLGYVE